MKTKRVVAMLLLMALVGCSGSTPAPVPTTPPTTAVATSPTDVPAAIEEPAATISENSSYRLQTLVGEAKSTCLEGNRRADDAVLHGATFMDACQDVPGQVWKLIPTQADGYYQLQTLFLEAENKCLEGNQIAPEAVLGGAAFMNDCQEVTGQLWKLADAGNGYYRLQTQFLEAQNKCLEGNSVTPDAVLQGAAFMDDCKDVTGQLWKLVPINQSAGPAEEPAGLDELAVAPEPLAVEIQGNTLTVVEPSTRLTGMTITQPEGSAAVLSQLDLGKIEIKNVPVIPEGVTPLSDVFVAPAMVEQTLELRFPLVDFPKDALLGNVDLYAYGAASDTEANIWVPAWIEYGYEESPKGPVVVVQVAGLGGLAFWGYRTPQDGGGTGSYNNPASKVLFKASFVTQAQSDPCTKEYANGIVSPQNFIGHTCTSGTTTVTLRGFGENTQTRWGGAGMTKQQLLQYVVDAQTWFTQNNMGFEQHINVHIHDTGGSAGYVKFEAPDNGKTLHLTDKEADSAKSMQSVIVHEYWHHAQYHQQTLIPDQALVGSRWIGEGSAMWFEDELYDSLENRYLFFNDTKLRIAEVGINSEQGDGPRWPYSRALFFKLMTRSCPQFVPQIRLIFSQDQGGEPTGIANLTSLFGKFGCDFGDHLGSDRSTTIEAALAYYNYATQFKDKVSLLDANEPDAPYFEKPPADRFPNLGATTVAEWLATPGKVATLPGVTIPSVGAYSFVVPGLTGTLPAGQVAQLMVESSQPVLVSLTSNDSQFSGMNTIGPDNDPHAWFSTATTTSTNTSSTTTGNTCSYSLGGSGVPELFVTLVNPSLSESAGGVKVTFQIVAASAAQQPPCDTPAAKPSATAVVPTQVPAAPTATPVVTTQVPATPQTPTGQYPLILTGHTRAVQGMAWSPDGSKIASASDDNTVRVWDATTGASLLTLTGHTNYVGSVAWSPDSSRLASASQDETVRVWDTATGASLLTLTGHTGRVERVAWSPDGSKLASASLIDETVRVWDAKTGTSLLTLTGHTDAVISVAWSPDGSKLVSASNDVTVWDAATGASLLTLTGHTGSVASVAWSPDGRKLVSASYDRTIRVWDAATGTSLLTLTDHTGAVYDGAWSPDGRKLASASEDDTVRVWDAATGTSLLTFTADITSEPGVVWSPDGSKLASATWDGTVLVWDATTGASLATLTGHTRGLSEMAWSPDGSKLASASGDQTIWVWDVSAK